MMNANILRRNLGALAVPAVCIVVLTYIGTQAFTGERGIFARERMDAEAEQLRTRLAALVDRRELLEKQIKLLRPDTLDPDMLDERVRAVLNFAAEGEITILQLGR